MGSKFVGSFLRTRIGEVQKALFTAFTQLARLGGQTLANLFRRRPEGIASTLTSAEKRHIREGLRDQLPGAPGLELAPFLMP